MKISTSIWSGQHPNAGRNIQHTILFSEKILLPNIYICLFFPLSFCPENYLTSVKNIDWIVAWVASMPEIAFFDFELKPRIMSDLSLFIQIGVEFFGESFVENFRSKFCFSTKNDEGEDLGLCRFSLPPLSIWSTNFVEF